MGYYIETLAPRFKANQLMELHGAKLEPGPFFDPSRVKIPICVVQNGPFDAAAVGFSQDEVDAFCGQDGRPRTWLSLSKEKVIELCPTVADELT